MIGRGRGGQGGGQGDNQLPSAFNQQAFMEAISLAAATIAHASATVSQRGLSNLSSFKAYHPPTFRRGGDPMIANH